MSHGNKWLAPKTTSGPGLGIVKIQNMIAAY
jgi:hypothetical protein